MKKKRKSLKSPYLINGGKGREAAGGIEGAGCLLRRAATVIPIATKLKTALHGHSNRLELRRWAWPSADKSS